MSEVNEYNFQYKLRHIELLDEYETLCLLEYAGKTNKWEYVNSICDYITYHGSVWLCQCLDLPNIEYHRYQPSCTLNKPVIYYSYKI
jgi:hypothetical protein